MTRGPVPPHERSWRHPSELAAPPHEPTSSLGRTLIGATATVGLLLVGVLALSMTPDRLGSPKDTRIVTTNVVADPGTQPAVGAPQSLADSVMRAVSTLRTSTSVTGDDFPETNPLVPAPSAPDLALTSIQATEPVATIDLPTDPTEPPQPSIPADSAPPVTARPEASTAAAFTTQADSVDVAPESSDAALSLLGANELALAGPSPATSSTAPGQSTTSTSSSSTSTSTSTSTTSSTTTDPAPPTTLDSAAKQLNNDS